MLGRSLLDKVKWGTVAVLQPGHLHFCNPGHEKNVRYVRPLFSLEESTYKSNGYNFTNPDIFKMSGNVRTRTDRTPP